MKVSAFRLVETLQGLKLKVWINGFQRKVPGPVALAPSGDSLEVQILRLYPRLKASEAWGWAPQ